VGRAEGSFPSQPCFPRERIADPVGGCWARKPAGEGNVAKPLRSAVKKQKWGGVLLAGTALIHTLLVVTGSAHLRLRQVCCRSTASPGRAVPADASSPLAPTLPGQGHRVPGHGWQRWEGLWVACSPRAAHQSSGRVARKGLPSLGGGGGCLLGALCNSGLLSLSPACGPGTFKSKQGEGPCSPCPPNSRTTSGAATVCTCRNGFFRADTDPADSACTSESCPGRGGEVWRWRGSTPGEGGVCCAHAGGEPGMGACCP